MKKKRILIVEDQGISALHEHQIMIDMGYEVTSIVMDGESAVKEAKINKPDLILMDIRLAGDMDGREAALIIRQESDIPIVFVTAYGNKKASIAGNYNVPDGFGYVVKPFTKKELLTEISYLLSD